MNSEQAAILASAFLQLQYQDASEHFDLINTNPRLVPAEDAGRTYAGRKTWVVWFFLKNLPEGVDLFPDYAEVCVDQKTGEAWWRDGKGKRSATSWRKPLLKKGTPPRKDDARK